MLFLKINLFLTGLFSLFALPSYGNFILSHIFLILSFYLIIILLLYYHVKKNVIKFQNIDIFIISLAFLYYATTLIGTLNSGQYKGIITSQIFLLVFFLIFIIYKFNFRLINTLLLGFIWSSFITSLYVIFDSFYFYSGNFKSLNERIWPEIFLGKAGEHTLTNISSYGGIIIFRPAGFSWDPGLSITGTVIAFVLIAENIVKIKYKKVFLGLLLIGILLSFSKTSIIALFFYFLLKIFKIDKLVIKFLESNKISFLNIIILLVFLSLFYIGFFIPYDSDVIDLSNARHLKYLTSVFYYPYVDYLLELIFGYGYTGVGVFFNKYVTWLKNENFYFGENLNPESTLTNLFFYGGFIGSLFWIITFLYSFYKGNRAIKIVLLTIILLAFGYSINSIWFNFIYLSLVVQGLRNGKNLH